MRKMIRRLRNSAVSFSSVLEWERKKGTLKEWE